MPLHTVVTFHTQAQIDAINSGSSAIKGQLYFLDTLDDYYYGKTDGTLAGPIIGSGGSGVTNKSFLLDGGAIPTNNTDTVTRDGKIILGTDNGILEFNNLSNSANQRRFVIKEEATGDLIIAPLTDFDDSYGEAFYLRRFDNELFSMEIGGAHLFLVDGTTKIADVIPTNDNKVIIGDFLGTPTERLSVQGNVEVEDTLKALKGEFSDQVVIGSAGIGSTYDLDVDGEIVVRGTNYASHFNFGPNEAVFIRPGVAAGKVEISDVAAGNVNIVKGGGNVGIGTDADVDDKLWVEGITHSTEYFRGVLADEVIYGNGGASYIHNPEGGFFANTSPATGGDAIIIILPTGFNDAVVKFTIDVYNKHATRQGAKITVGGLLDSVTGTWKDTSVITLANNEESEYTVRFGSNAAGKAVIWLGELTTQWNFPVVKIKDVQVFDEDYSLSTWHSGWAINFTTVFETVDEVVTDSLVESNFESLWTEVNGNVYRNSYVGVNIDRDPQAGLEMRGNLWVEPENATDTLALKVGRNRSGNGIAILDLIGDSTYSTYGFRAIRGAGVNSNTDLLHRGTGNFRVRTFDAGNLQFWTDNVERARIDSEGNMGIGTSTPDAPLHIAGGSDVGPVSGGFLIIGESSSLNMGLDDNEIQARNNGAPSPLHLNHSGSHVVMNTPNLATAPTRILVKEGSGDSSEIKYVDYSEIAGANLWETNGGPIWRMSNVGILNNNPQVALDVVGEINATGRIVTGVGSGSVGLTLNDGHGNANVTFNHEGGVPDNDGNSGRIRVNVDTVGNAQMLFGLASNVTAGTATTPTYLMTLQQANGGRLGINTLAPLDTFDVRGSISVGVVGAAGVEGGEITFRGTTSNPDNYHLDRANDLFRFHSGGFVHQSISIPTGNIDVGGGVISSTAKFQVTNKGDGKEVLRLNTDRPWSFFQQGVDGLASLVLRTEVGDKHFRIQNNDSVDAFNIRSSSGDAYIKGRLELGTITPYVGGAKLEVDGAIVAPNLISTTGSLSLMATGGPGIAGLTGLVVNQGDVSVNIPFKLLNTSIESSPSEILVKSTNGFVNTIDFSLIDNSLVSSLWAEANSTAHRDSYVAVNQNSEALAPLQIGNNVAATNFANLSDYQILLWKAGTNSAPSSYGIGIRTSTMAFNVPTTHTYDFDFGGVSQIRMKEGQLSIGNIDPTEKLHIRNGNILIDSDAGNSLTLRTRVGNGNGTTLYLEKSRGGSGTQTVPILNDVIGNIIGRAYNGTGYEAITRIISRYTSSGTGQLEFNVFDGGVSKTGMVLYPDQRAQFGTAGAIVLNEGNGNATLGADITIGGNSVIATQNSAYYQADYDDNGVGGSHVWKRGAKTTGGTTMMVLNESAQLGINNNAPEYTLDVNGPARLGTSGNAALIITNYNGELPGIPAAGTDGGAQIVGPLLSKTVWDIRANDNKDGIYWRVPTTLSSTPVIDKVAFTIQADGRIGVNTGEPLNPLHVEGSSRFNGNVNMVGNSAITWVDHGGGWAMQDVTWIRSTGNKNVYVNQGIRADGWIQKGANGSQFHVNTAGDVGINRPAPLAKLHVEGQIRVENADILLNRPGSANNIFLRSNVDNTNMSNIYFDAARGGNSISDVTVNKVLGNVVFRGYANGAYQSGALIRSTVRSAVTGANFATSLDFYTREANSAWQLNAQLEQDGNFWAKSL